MCLGRFGRIVGSNRNTLACETHVDDSSKQKAKVDVVDVDLEKLEHCGRKEKGWYVCTVHVSGAEWRSVRSVTCTLTMQLLEGDDWDDGPVCLPCRSLLTKNSSLRNAVRRTSMPGKINGGKQRKKTCMSKAEMALELRKEKKKYHRRGKQIVAHRHSSKVKIALAKQAGTKVRDQLASGNLRGVVSALQHIRKLEVSTAKHGTCPIKTAQAVATDILSAVCRKLEGKSNQGNRLGVWTKAFMSTLRHQHGEVGLNLFTRNLLIGSDRTAFRAVVFRPKVPFMARLTEATFRIIAYVYTLQKQALGITTTCPVEVAEDESAVQAKAEWDPPSNQVIGKCGPLCAKKCETIVTCRRVEKCGDPHECVPTGDYSHTIEDGDVAAYEKVRKWHEESRTGTQVRLMVINPMDVRLAQLPILFVPTCLTFTAARYVAEQWRLLRVLYDEFLLPVLGPLVSEGASDGASTRRAHHVRHASGTLDPGLVLFTLEAPGFVYHGTARVCDDGRMTDITIRKDQDYIHAGKKLLSPSDISSRNLELGPFIISLNMLEIVRMYCHHGEHGMRATDTERSGFDSMDVPSMWRLLSLKVATCVARCIHGIEPNGEREGCAPQTQLRGLQTYLMVLRRYAEIFMSRKLKHRERVRSAGMVVTFLRLWRLWLQKTANKDLKTCYLTNESVIDATLSCHFAVLWLKMFRELYPHLEPLLYRTGTDVCEIWFSLLGGFIQNKRVYSVLEGLQTIRTKLNSEIAYASGIAKPSHKRRIAGVWDELPDDDERNGSQVEYPSDAAMIAAWRAGADEARSLCEELDMKPAGTPAWWRNPHDHVPKPDTGRGGFGDGEEVIVARELDEDHEESGAGSNGNSSSSESDDDEDEAQQAVEVAVDVVLDAAVEAEAEVAHQGQRKKIIATMEVPSVGVVYKQKVLMWLNGAVRTLSADRNKRVQTMVTDMERCEQWHKLSENDWWIGPGDDVAVLFEKNGVKTFHVGRVIKMRRRNKGRGGSVQYRRKVLIHEDRADLEGLQLYLHWYSPREVPQGQQQLVYEYTHTDTEPVDIATVICPCALMYTADDSTYTMQATTYEVIPLAINLIIVVRQSHGVVCTYIGHSEVLQR